MATIHGRPCESTGPMQFLISTGHEIGQYVQDDLRCDFDEHHPAGQRCGREPAKPWLRINRDEGPDRFGILNGWRLPKTKSLIQLEIPSIRSFRTGTGGASSDAPR